MRSLLAPLIVTLALAALCCCEKGKGMTSWEGSWDVNPFQLYYEYYKSPMEQMHERCENYPPCDYLSDQIGFSMAYNRFFGRY
uniref:Gla domain-containing protein n=1 Tax=Strigops habroptila TaxID=2489341 RepID=A0A672TG96_STRHB